MLRLRQEVFVVEQECAYLDADGLDPHCHHLLGHDLQGLVATARLVPPGRVHPLVAIGRVVTAPRVRGSGLGRPLMREAMRHAAACWPGGIHLGGQAYLRGFYESLGFAVSGPAYDEDGIPHLPMDSRSPS